MERNCSAPIRELTENEMASAAGGVIGGGVPAPELPSLLFWTPNIVCLDNGAQGGVIWIQPG